MAKKKTGLHIVVNAKQKSYNTEQALNVKPEKTHSKGNAINVRNTTREGC